MEQQVMNRSEDRLWQVVVDRDARRSGEFVMGVTTTGIYCRPGCPARLPKRKNVRFFDDPATAERAGFRACKRCHPNRTPLRDRQVETVRWVCEYLDSHPDDQPPLEQLGRIAGVSPWHLQRIFKRVLGISPREYQQAKKLGTFKRELKRVNVLEALMEAGYGSTSRVYEGGKATLGMTPATYRRGGLGARIRYAVVASRLGRMMVAATEHGICKIALGARVRELEQLLLEEFPNAEIHRDARGIAQLAKKVLAMIEANTPNTALPIDIQATSFQWKVWSMLQQIPMGETWSYSEVAAAIGQPTAARAVARACATNPVPLIIPCHRVIQGNGGLGGYRYGVERKKKLLETEEMMSKKSRSLRTKSEKTRRAG